MLVTLDVAKAELRVVVDDIVVVHDRGFMGQQRKDIVILKALHVLMLMRSIKRYLLGSVKSHALPTRVDKDDRVVPVNYRLLNDETAQIIFKFFQSLSSPFLKLGNVALRRVEFAMSDTTYERGNFIDGYVSGVNLSQNESLKLMAILCIFLQMMRYKCTENAATIPTSIIDSNGRRV